MSLISRYLEENGIPTVMIASAKDIVEHCGVARLLFVDYPLGNPCGEPSDDISDKIKIASRFQGAQFNHRLTIENLSDDGGNHGAR